MKYGLFFVLITLISCSENDDRHAINRNLWGNWKIHEATSDEWGNGIGGKSSHPYQDKIITFADNGTWKLSDTVEGSLNGTYKVQPESRGEYIIHIDCLTPEGRPSRKEYWEVSYGRGDRLMAVFERKGGWVNLNLERSR